MGHIGWCKSFIHTVLFLKTKLTRPCYFFWEITKRGREAPHKVKINPMRNRLGAVRPLINLGPEGPVGKYDYQKSYVLSKCFLKSILNCAPWRARRARYRATIMGLCPKQRGPLLPKRRAVRPAVSNAFCTALLGAQHLITTVRAWGRRPLALTKEGRRPVKPAAGLTMKGPAPQRKGPVSSTHTPLKMQRKWHRNGQS